MAGVHDDDVRRAKSGDRSALNRLLERNQERLNRLAHRHLGPRLRLKVRTSDLLQSTYLDVFRGLAEFEGETEEAFVGWFGRIVERNIQDKVRYLAAQRRNPLREVSESKARRSPARGLSPSAQLAFVDELLLVGRAIDRLPAEYRRVIELKVVKGLDHREVAKKLGRTEVSARTLLARARAALLVGIDELRRQRT
jgi:RNA polymerase sigma-70 factor (ECF subfamily)